MLVKRLLSPSYIITVMTKITVSILRPRPVLIHVLIHGPGSPDGDPDLDPDLNPDLDPNVDLDSNTIKAEGMRHL